MEALIKTKRLIIREFNESDNQFVFELLNSEGWIKFIGNRNINSLEDADAYIQKIKANEKIKYWTVTKSDNAEQIGLITLIYRDYLDHPDIGFAFLPHASGKGYAFEATKKILNHLAFSSVFSKLYAITLPENKSSIKLLERLGLIFEKELEVDNEMLFLFSASSDKFQSSAE